MKLFKKYRDYYTIIGNGTKEAVLYEIELLTKQNESYGIMLVDEEIFEDTVYVRCFASEKNGFEFELIIAESMEKYRFFKG